MAAKQILSLVVASTWVVNLLIDNQIKEPKAYAFGSFLVVRRIGMTKPPVKLGVGKNS